MSRIAFLFPGQGAQHIGMSRSICERFEPARRLFERASEVLGFDLAQRCFEGPQEELDRTDVCQPALFVSSLAALEMLRAEQPGLIEQCNVAAGLSLGEYTALTFAGALSFDDGLRVVRKRGEAMQAAARQTPSGMVSALLLKDEQIEQVLQQARSAGRIWVANYLCPLNTVLSGEKAACEAAAPLIEQAGGRPIPLSVAGAFHTEIMAPALAELESVLRSVTIQPPRLPVISNVDARPHSDPAEIRDILVRQVVNPVLWDRSMRELLSAGETRFFEIGPGKVLKGLLKRIDRKASCETVNDTP